MAKSAIRPPSEKMLFPVKRPGEFFAKKIFDIIFSFFLQQNREKNRFCSRVTGHKFGHPLYRKQTFFKGGIRWRVGSMWV